MTHDDITCLLTTTSRQSAEIAGLKRLLAAAAADLHQVAAGNGLTRSAVEQLVRPYATAAGVPLPDWPYFGEEFARRAIVSAA